MQSLTLGNWLGVGLVRCNRIHRGTPKRHHHHTITHILCSSDLLISRQAASQPGNNKRMQVASWVPTCRQVRQSPALQRDKSTADVSTRPARPFYPKMTPVCVFCAYSASARPVPRHASSKQRAHDRRDVREHVSPAVDTPLTNGQARRRIDLICS